MERTTDAHNRTETGGSRGKATWAALLGICATLVGTAALIYQDHHHEATVFERHAESALDAFAGTMNRHLQRTHELGTFVRAGADLHEGVPEDAAQPARAHGLKFLAWMEPGTGGAEPGIVPLVDAAGGRIVQQVLRGDTEANHGHLQVMEHALNENALTATPGVVLFHIEGGPVPGVIVFNPVQRGGDPAGVVALAVRLDQVAASARGGRPVDIHVFERSSGENRLLLHGPGSGRGVAERMDPAALEAGMHARHDLDVADREWTVYITPEGAAPWMPAHAFLFLAGGVTLSGVTMLLVARETRQRELIARQLAGSEQRTSAIRHELADAYDTVQQESARRISSEHYGRLLENHCSDLVARITPFQEVFDKAGVGMALFHPRTGYCLYVNQALCDMLGYAQDELLELSYRDLTHPADQHATQEQLDQIRTAARDTYQLEKRYLHKSGRVIWITVSGSLIRDHQGRLVCVACQIRDITERKAVEQALEEINRRHDLILNAVAEAIFGLDTRGNIVFANSAACHLLGREAATLEGQSLHALLHGNEAPAPERWPFHASVEERHVKQEEGAVFRRGDGSAFVADYTAAPIIDNDRVTGFVVVMTDATERQEGEARFRSAFDDAAVGMALIRTDGTFLRVNDALCELTGYDHDALLSLPAMELLHPDDRAANYRVNRRVLKGQPTAPSQELRVCHRDGGVVWVVTSTSVVRDPDGTPRYLLKQAQDITPRKVAEAALRNSEARFRGIFDQAAIAMALLNGPEGRVQRVNGALTELFGCTAGSLDERPLLEFIHVDDHHLLQEALDRRGTDRDRPVVARVTNCHGGIATVLMQLSVIDDGAPGTDVLSLLQMRVRDDHASAVTGSSNG